MSADRGPGHRLGVAFEASREGRRRPSDLERLDVRLREVFDDPTRDLGRLEDQVAKCQNRSTQDGSVGVEQYELGRRALEAARQLGRVWHGWVVERRGRRVDTSKQGSRS